MICPKCGFEQPDSVDCMRCGIVISRYKGPVLAAAAPPPPPPPPPLPLSAAAEPPVRPAFAAAATAWAPEPQMATAGGTLYEGPLAAADGGGTTFTGALQGGPVGRTRSGVPGTFESGKILGEAFSIYFSNFLPFLLLTVLALSPMLASFAIFTGSTSTTTGGGDLGLMLVSGILFLLSLLVCPQLATASITYGVFQQMRGRDATIADCLGKGLSSLFSVLWLAILQGLGTMLGLLLFIIPGIIWALRWSVSVPAAVEERPGALGAMRRSRFLTDGYKGQIFGVLFILNMLNQLVQTGLNLALSESSSGAILALGISTIFSVGVQATATGVMYYRLRSIKESVDVDQIASVFA
jgi:hypothetical protein